MLRTLGLVVVSLLLLVLVQACEGNDLGDQVKDRARDAAQDAIGTAEATLEAKGAQVRGSAEAKGDELRGTAETLGGDLKGTAMAKGDEIRPTIDAAATDVHATIADLRDVSETLDGFPNAVLEALATLGDQAASLRQDESLVDDREWLRDTNEAITILGARGADALTVAESLEQDDTLPHVRAPLRQLGDMLVDTSAGLGEHVAAGDADGFLSMTNRLALIATSVNLLQGLLGGTTE